MGLREQILNCNDFKWVDVVVPEWENVTIRIITMDGGQRSDFEARLYNDETKKLDSKRFMENLIIATARDPLTGASLFEPEDAILLSAKSSAVLSRLAEIAAKLNGVGDQADEAKKNS